MYFYWLLLYCPNGDMRSCNCKWTMFSYLQFIIQHFTFMWVCVCLYTHTFIPKHCFYPKWFKKVFPCPLEMTNVVCIFFKDVIYLFIWAHERAQGGGVGREKQTSCWAGSLTRGSVPGLWDHELNWRQSLNKLSHPVTPRSLTFNVFIDMIDFKTAIIIFVFCYSPRPRPWLFLGSLGLIYLKDSWLMCYICLLCF